MRAWSRGRSAGWVVAAMALVASAVLVFATLREVPAQGCRRVAVRASIEDDEERALVRALMLDLWSDADTGTSLDVVASVAGVASLRLRGVQFEVLSADTDADAAAERARLAEAEAARPGTWFSEYRDFETVDAHLDTLALRRPDLARVESLGTTAQGRPVRGLRISAAPEGAETIVLDGGQHAREWISVMATTCIADRLVTEANVDPRIEALLGTREVWVVPVVNPDGYVYSWESDRYWRKNRQEPYGVDLNRNWSVGFGGRGSSSRRLSQVYRGPHAFSERETQAMRDLMKRERVVAHIDFHSFGQLILYPWSHTKETPADRDRLAALGDAMASAIIGTHGENYRLMPGAGLYTAGGTALDWSYGALGAMGYTIELRPAGGNGFVLPPEQIIPTCDEALEAVLALAQRL